jgi:hypothetical protein
MRKFMYKGTQVIATNLGPDATVLTTSKKLPPFTSEVIWFATNDGRNCKVTVPIGTFATSSETELKAIYEDAY